MCMFFLVVWFFRKFVFSCFSSCKSSFDISMSFTKLISVEIVCLIIRMTVWTYYKNTFSHPQSIAECGFTNDVQKGSDLYGCERISSDLIMKSRNFDNISQNIIAVDGCISIVGTSLKSIDFLKLTDVSKAAATCKSGGQSGQFL